MQSLLFELCLFLVEPLFQLLVLYVAYPDRRFWGPVLLFLKGNSAEKNEIYYLRYSSTMCQMPKMLKIYAITLKNCDGIQKLIFY